MRIGIPPEIKPKEGRVALIPAAAAELVRAGHEVYLQSLAGMSTGYPDEAFTDVGVKIAPDAAELRSPAEGRRQLEGRFLETQRYSKQLEVQCQETQQKLQAEELRMRSKFEDLESQILELLDRSSNGHGTEQKLEQMMEIELAARRHVLEGESERRLKDAEAEWQTERDRRAVEIRHLKQQLATKPDASRTAFIGRIFSRK